ncbi:uncharacterized protein LOC132314569 [Cornus florida]|uniref:uncharacterized protein LOC132314569 n=1 Tax=Cornus florida TaxID=4283 RepID=UPI0028A051FF|nr:uncharacterized protein LOC132314569 [Cornus florida]
MVGPGLNTISNLNPITHALVTSSLQANAKNSMHTVIEGINENAKLQPFIGSSSWSFPQTITAQIPELIHMQPPCPAIYDKKIWIASTNGHYCFRQTAALLAGQFCKVPWYNPVWKSPIIPRMKFNLWLALQCRLPTLDSKSMTKHQNVCTLCSNSPESQDHLYFSCPFISPIWRYIKDKCHFSTAITNWSNLVMLTSHMWKSNSPQNMVRKICLSLVVYHTWEERNSRIFKKKNCSQRVVLAKINSSITSILQFGFLSDSTVSRRILLEWNLPPSCCRPPSHPSD